MTITSFHDQHEFLSNFSPSPVILDGVTYPTVEHAFQAAKTLDSGYRQAICTADTPARAKRLGRLVPLRADWEKVKFDVMRSLLDQKFAPGTELAQKLIATYPEELIEGNTWGDRFWGAVLVSGQWDGSNWLGRLLMQIREVLVARYAIGGDAGQNPV